MKPEASLFGQVDDSTEAEADAEGLADISADRGVPHAEVAARLATWGTPEETPAPAHGFK